MLAHVVLFKTKPGIATNDPRVLALLSELDQLPKVVPGIVTWVRATGAVDVATTVPRAGVPAALLGVEMGRSFSHAVSPTLIRARIAITITKFSNLGIEGLQCGRNKMR